MELERHIKYYERCLVMFPGSAQGYDSSHSSLVFFCLLGLHLLGRPLNQRDIRDYVEKLWLPNGFRGSPSHFLTVDSSAADSPAGRYDPPTLSSTFFAICSLGLAQDATTLGRINRQSVLEYVLACQTSQGTFSNVASPRFGEASVRHLFTGIAILALLKVQGPQVEQLYTAATDYVLQCQNFDGGFGDVPHNGSESHAGLTYCCVAALKLMGRSLPAPQKSRVLKWLAHRQQPSGGFNGRANKPEDTCYAFWVSATLAVLGHLEFVDTDAATSFLLSQGQDTLLGGFAKTSGGRADPLHSCLGLCALRIWQNAELDPAFCLPVASVAFIKACF